MTKELKKEAKVWTVPAKKDKFKKKTKETSNLVNFNVNLHSGISDHFCLEICYTEYLG